MLLMRRCLNMYLFIAVLGLHCCMGLSPVAEIGLLSSRSHRLLTALASPIVEHGLWSPGQIAVVHGLSCSAGCEIFPDKGLIGSMSPALAGGFFTTEPPGKPLSCFFNSCDSPTAVGFALSPSPSPSHSGWGNHSRAAICWRSRVS